MFVARCRRAFDSADYARHDLLLSWALKKGVGRDQGRENSSQGLYDDGCFTNRMSDIRRRLLDVLGLHRKNVEVCGRLDFSGVALIGIDHALSSFCDAPTEHGRALWPPRRRNHRMVDYERHEKSDGIQNQSNDRRSKVTGYGNGTGKDK